jgi:thioredoxin reductase
MSAREWDVVVVGGGPAGLAAALWLARYRRRVVILDTDQPRNEAAWAVHGFPGLADPTPSELRARIREQAETEGAAVQSRRVTALDGAKDRFTVEAASGPALETRRILLAYGRQDRVPEIPGLGELYGSSVFHCPDCDGPAAGDVVGVLGHDRAAAALALYLLTWADQAVLLTNGEEPELTGPAEQTLDRYSVEIRQEPIERLVGSHGRLERVRLATGEHTALDSLFFHRGSDPASALGPASGCRCDRGGDIEVDTTLQTSVPGIYAAGDIIGRPHLAISAAAGGVRAALSIHRSLLPAEFRL